MCKLVIGTKRTVPAVCATAVGTDVTRVSADMSQSPVRRRRRGKPKPRLGFAVRSMTHHGQPGLSPPGLVFELHVKYETSQLRRRDFLARFGVESGGTKEVCQATASSAQAEGSRPLQHEVLGKSPLGSLHFGHRVDHLQHAIAARAAAPARVMDPSWIPTWRRELELKIGGVEEQFGHRSPFASGELEPEKMGRVERWELGR